MPDVRTTAHAIEAEIRRLRVLGHCVEAVVISPEMQQALAEASLGYWHAVPGFASMFNLKAVIEPIEGGWAVRVRED